MVMALQVPAISYGHMGAVLDLGVGECSGVGHSGLRLSPWISNRWKGDSDKWRAKVHKMSEERNAPRREMTMNHESTTKLLTLIEAAALLRISPCTAGRWLRKRRIPGLKVGRRWLINDRSIAGLVNATVPADKP